MIPRVGAIYLLGAVVLSAQLTPAEIVVENGCTLVDAVTAANTDTAVGGCPAGSGDDEVVLTADVVLTEASDGANGLPVINSSITFRGNGFEVRRDPAAPDFRLLSVVTEDFYQLVTLEDVTLAGGSLPLGNGGAILFDTFFANLVLTNTTVSGNEAKNGGGLYVAGGYLRIHDSLIVDNTAIGGSGGGIRKAYGADLYLYSSTVTNNTSGAGGGLSTRGGFYFGSHPGSSVVFDSTFTGNSATYGGGIEAFGGLYMTNSTVSGNYATVDSGAFEHGAGILSLTGTCPGPTTVTATDAPSDTRMLLFQGTGRGPSQVPSGVCAGTDFDLTDPHIAGFFPTDSNGGGSVVLDLTEADCGQFLQGVTEAACATTNVVQFDSLGVNVSIAGTCPGPLDVTVVNAEPNRILVLYAGNGGGTTTVAGGPCAGTELDLGPARRWKTLMSDSNGEATVSFTSSGGWCSRSIQAVDGLCSTSNVADTP